MELLKPSLGLFFWALIIFVALFFILKKMAWGPIMEALKEREDSIQSSLDEAEKARQEMKNLHAENEALLIEARTERDSLLKEAREMKEKMLADAKAQAEGETKRLIENAREQIRSEKLSALTEIKSQVGLISIEIAEKVLRQDLADKAASEQIVDKLVGELHLN